MFRNHVPERWPKISMWNRACSGTKFHQPMRFRDVPALNWLPERSSCTESVHSLQNPRCSPCDLANFAFGTMVPEHLGSFFFAGHVLFRNNSSVFDENLGVPEHFIVFEYRASVPGENPVGFARWTSNSTDSDANRTKRTSEKNSGGANYPRTNLPWLCCVLFSATLRYWHGFVMTADIPQLNSQK